MNLKTTKATILLGVAGIVVVLLAGWLLVIGPTAATVGETRAAITETEDRTTLLALQLQGLESQADDLSATAKAAEQIAVIWPPTADQPGFFQAVSGAAIAAGFAPGDITTLSPSAPIAVGAVVADGSTPDPAVDPATGEEVAVDPATAPYAVQTVTISMEGTADEARAFLRRLEGLTRALLVKSVALTRGEEDVVTLDVIGTTYVAPPVGAPAADEEPAEETTETTEAPSETTTQADG